MKHFLSFLCIALVLMSNAVAEPLTTITNQQQLSYFMHTYYLDPHPELIDSAMLLVNDAVKDKKSARAPTLMSFSCMFALNAKAQKNKWKRTIKYLDNPAKSLLTEAISRTPEELLNSTKLSPAKNDMNWACFFITGDIKYLNNIASNLKYLNERGDLNKYLTAASAKWSLASNSHSHTLVRMAMESMRIGDVPEMREIAEEILTKDPEYFLEEMKSVVKTQKENGGWGNVTPKND